MTQQKLPVQLGVGPNSHKKNLIAIDRLEVQAQISARADRNIAAPFTLESVDSQ